MIFFWLIPWTVIGLLALWWIYSAITHKNPEEREETLPHGKR